MTYKEKREYEQLTKELEQLENEQKTWRKLSAADNSRWRN